MVMFENDLPELPNKCEDNETTDGTIYFSVYSAEPEDEEQITPEDYHYQPLPLNPVEENEENDNEVETNPETDTPETECDVPSTSSVDAENLQEVEPTTSKSDGGIQLDDDKIAEVKKIMQNVNLPSDAVPEWAQHIPEDQWISHLINKMEKGDKDL